MAVGSAPKRAENRSPGCFTASIALNGTVKRIVVFPGLPLADLKQTLQAAFGTQKDIVGLKDAKQEVHFPLSLLARAPAFFSGREESAASFTLLLEGQPPESENGRETSREEKGRRRNGGRNGSLSMIFDLNKYEVSHLIEIFRKAAPTGVIDRITFQKCFAQLLGGAADRRTRAVLNRLFDIFDRDRNGVVDATEFLSGLSVLVGGERDQKIRAAFDLYDTNGDGFISLEEMTRYLTSVFAVISETSPDIFKLHEVSPQELGRITAQQCFLEADLNRDGKLSFEEFRSWYSGTASRESVKRREVDVEVTGSSLLSSGTVTQSVDKLRRMTGLGSISVQQLVKFFGAAARDGELDQEAFRRCFESIIAAQQYGAQKLPSSRTAKEVRALIDRLFLAFDENRNGRVSLGELASGLSVLCGGSSDDKVSAIFQLYDQNGDGFMTLDEMTAYLTSVFRVLFEASPTAQQTLGISPEELGIITAEQAFVQADLNHDGRLSFAEFKRWYSKRRPAETREENIEGKTVKAPLPSPSSDTRFRRSFSLLEDSRITREEVQRVTNLTAYTVEDVFEHFAESANEEGLLTREAFMGSFLGLMRSSALPYGGVEPERAQFILDELFKIFDTDNNSALDFTELACGLSVLCAGSPEEKIKAAFSLFDVNDDGYISLDELATYFTSVFRVLYQTSPSATSSLSLPFLSGDEETLADLQVDPVTLGRITAQQAFLEADTDRDGRISLEEFQRWYKTSAQSLLKDEDGRAEEPEDGVQVGIPETRVSSLSNSLQEIRRVTNLQSYDVKDVFKFFASSADANGNISRQVFYRCFNKLIQKALGGKLAPGEQQRTRQVLDRLFSLFDEDKNNLIDVQELGSGLSILCGGSRDDKVRSAFELYDYDGDGYIDRGEMVNYLTSVYKVLFEASPDTAQSMEVSPEVLATITAEQCFAEADLNKDGKLSFEEFKAWYAQPPQQIVEDNTLREIKRLTNLESYPVEEVLAMFAAAADEEDGAISKEEFFDCFEDLIGTWVTDMARAKVVVGRLFDLFDVDGNGKVDFSELASGLTVLCAGTRDEKVKAAFSLYDEDGDGYISLEEMILYLTSVFKVLYQTNPGTHERMGVRPEELARVTAEQAFLEADLDHDGRLSFEEFRRWYARGGIEAVEDEEEEETDRSLLNISSAGLEEIKRQTGLGELNVEDVFEKIAEAADNNGALTLSAYRRAVNDLLIQTKVGTGGQTARLSRARLLLERFFDLFDARGEGVVDFAQVASGLSVLCGGTRQDKVKAAFSLYDLDGDGFISIEEMSTYLSSVFLVLFEVTPGLQRRLGVSAQKLGESTAQQAFQEVDLDRDGRLNYEEFTLWYSSGEARGITEAGSLPRDVRQARHVTNLESYTPDEVFEIFAEHATEEGMLTRPLFNKCFRILIGDKYLGFTEEERLQAKAIVDRLFAIFDPLENGLVDFTELVSGLSVLCEGSRDSKVEAAFSLYDYDGDGFISLEEMKRYLRSVFKVLYEVAPFVSSQLSISAEVLGDLTALQAFKEADTDRDGRLSFDEFQLWYIQASPEGRQGHTAEPPPEWMSLQEVRRLTNLQNFDAEDVFEVFAKKADDEGVLSWEVFRDCFSELMGQRLGENEDEERASIVVRRLFSVFDRDKNGVVDFSELASGLSILCGGSREDKVAAAFALYDYDGDGYISLEEMTRYLASVFKVLYEVAPGTKERLGGVSPYELAAITAEEAFAAADLNHDGLLSLEEFKKWYVAPYQEKDWREQEWQRAQEHAAKEERSLNRARKKKPALELLPRWTNLKEARRAFNLQTLAPSDVFEVFAKNADRNGLLTQQAFQDSFDALLKRKQPSHSRQTSENRAEEIGNMDEEGRQEKTAGIVKRIFHIFDTEERGVVDFKDVVSGLAALCGGSRDDKVKSAFSLYDYNGDGYISLEEMTRYLTSVFKVLGEVSEEISKRMTLTPAELGELTARQAFLEADSDSDGKLSFDEFKHWYLSPSSQSLEQMVDNSVPSWMSLKEVRRLTNLHRFPAEDIFEIFALAANDDGLLDRSSFLQCFQKILRGRSLSSVDRERLSFVIDRLFRIFDTERNGMVDFSELASGISVLCGGRKEDKVQAAFSLYDLNGDGFISLEEMTRYLISVFKVLYQVSPESIRIKVSPEELGIATAEEAFEQADLNHDGKLSFEEFQCWYLNADSSLVLPEVEERGVPSWFSLTEIKALTGLGKCNAEEVFEIFARAADQQGILSPAAFRLAFSQLAELAGIDSDKKRLSLAVSLLFRIFDTDKSGGVDFSELASGLSVICGGSRDEKVQAAFSLYDINGDGYISLEEMTRYLSSVFRLLYETTAGTSQKIGVSPQELAAITAEQCFAEADLDGDGRLSFEEFQRWYSKAGIDVETTAEHALRAAGDRLGPQRDSNASEVSITALENLEEARRITKLDLFEVDDVIEIFEEAVPDKVIGKKDFVACLDKIIELGGGHDSEEDKKKSEDIINRLFILFDEDHNDLVDFNELASGLSVLCGSRMEDKVKAAFALYDTDRDGYISRAEMVNYLSSIFKVMYETSPDVRAKMGVDPPELARITAEQCFREADTNADGKISLDEFEKWCSVELLQA